jgi:catechol 2,3-dioxygenase-like lactoylglutathione lyase family enzyme
MINGAHVMIFTQDEDADRAFLRDILGIACIDAGEGWLIYKLPPTELGVHGGPDNDVHTLYLMCENLEQAIASLKAKGAECSEPFSASWGTATSIALPGGGKLGLYQPRHQHP